MTIAGASATFTDAASEAEGSFGGAANPWNLWRVAHIQAESGLKDEARTTLERAVRALPGVVGDHDKDSQTVRSFSAIVEEQARTGAREAARKTVDRLLDFSKTLFASSPIRNARAGEARKIAAALAAVGDFEAAFAWSERERHAGEILGEIAVAASKSLDRQAAGKFVHEAAERLAKIESLQAAIKA